MATHFILLRHRLTVSTTLRLILGLLMVLIIVACSNDDDPPEFDFPLDGSTLSIDDIAGNWTATSATFQVVGGAIEIVGAGGSLTLDIQNSGRFTATIGFPGEADEVFRGQMGFSGSQLVLLDDMDEPGDEAFLNAVLSPEDLLLLSGIIEFDFDGDGNFEPTEVDFIMER